MKQRRRKFLQMIELLETRQLLSCAVAQPESQPVFVYADTATVSVVKVTTIGAVVVQPGTYTGKQFNNLLVPAPAPLAKVSVISELAAVTPGHPSNVSATITDPAGVPLTDGFITFYAAAPAYDTYQSQSIPCLDHAGQNRTVLGTVDVAAGHADLSVSSLPAGTNWVWAEYASASIASPVRSDFQTISSTAMTGIRVEHKGTYTPSNPPQMAFTLTGENATPLLASAFAAPASTLGNILTAQGWLNINTPNAVPAWGAVPYSQILTSTRNINGVWLYLAPNVASGYSAAILNTGTAGSTSASVYAGSNTISSGGVAYTVGGGTLQTGGGTFTPGLGGGTIQTGGSTFTPGLGGGNVFYIDGRSVTWSGSVLTVNGSQIPTSVFYTTHAWTHVQNTAPMPTGSISIREGDQTLFSTSISNVGTALAHLNSLAAGHHHLTIAYAGDANFAASTQLQQLNITPTPVTITLALSSPDVVTGSYYTAHVDVRTAIKDFVAPSGRVELLVDGVLFTRIPLNNSAKNINIDLPVGEHNVRAVFVGDNNCSPASSQSVAIRVRANVVPVGNIWVNAQGRLRGQVLDANQPETAIITDILIDGVPLTRFSANRPAPANINQPAIQPIAGDHSFVIGLPVLSVGTHTIQACAYDPNTGLGVQFGDNYILTVKAMPASPVPVAAPAVPTVLVGGGLVETAQVQPVSVASQPSVPTWRSAAFMAGGHRTWSAAR